uniref:Uncharacterized protein n=1 Tax=Photinus pyralis TaxID=7054 RepID=A0A1Y1K3R4_PHOPY
MSTSTEEFIAQFRNLNGTTVGEQQSSLRRLLNSLSPEAIAALDFSQLVPATRLEEKLKTEALIYLRKTPELIELLKTEDRATAKRIFKLGPWFFEKAFEDVTGSQLVNDLFPHISYNVKMKLLNKLAVCLRNVEQADDVFKAVRDKYGLNLALKLLPACSFKTALPHIVSAQKLPPQQLLSIVKKYGHQHPQVFETLTKYNIPKDCNKVLAFLKRNYFEEIVLQHEHFQAYQKIGKRPTRKFISKYKEDVIADPRKYYEILHNKQIPKSLQRDFPRFFANLYPNKLNQFGESQQLIVTKLNTLPTKIDGLNLYLSTFQKLYGSEIWDHPEYVTENLLRNLTPAERELRLKVEYKKNLSEDEWMSLHKTAVSVPFFLKRISLTSDIDARLELVKFLVNSCGINADLDGLEKVCNYVLSRHRNDHIRIRVAFMTSVLRNFKLEKLREAHWTSLNDMIQIFEMNQESFYDREQFEEGYIHYRLLNNLPVFDLLKERVLAKNRAFNIVQTSPQYEKFCLVTFGEIINGGLHKLLYSHYLFALINWNNRHRDDEMSLFQYPEMIDDFQCEIAKGVNMSLSISDSIIGYLLAKSDQKSEYLRLYLITSSSYTSVLDNLVKTLPTVVAPQMENALHFILQNGQKFTVKFWRHCQYLSHLNLPQTAIGLCLEMIKEKPENYQNYLQEHALFAVTSLMSTAEFARFADDFSPSDSHVDRDKKRFAVQKMICKNLRNLRQVRESASIALQYCKSDYFRFVRGSMFSVCGKIKEDYVSVILKQLKSKMEYKRSLQIAARAMPSDCHYTILKELMANAKKMHTRRFLLKTAFRLFLKDASDYHWELVKESLQKIDSRDKESLDLFFQPNKIPTSYLITYQIFAWDYLFRLPNKEGELDHKRKSIIDSVTDEGSQLLPVDFCENIINGYLFKSDVLDGLHTSAQVFGAKYVVNCKNEREQERRLDFVMNIFKYYVCNRWKRREFRQQARTICSSLVQTFCAPFLENGNRDKSILRQFYNKWLEIVPSREAFNDYLFLRLTLMRASNTFVQEFVELCQEIIATYGLVTVDFIYMVFKEVYLTAVGENGRYDIIDKLIGTECEACALIAILLIDDNEPYDSDIAKRHNLVIEKLQGRDNMAVNIFLNRHIRGTTSLEYY